MEVKCSFKRVITVLEIILKSLSLERERERERESYLELTYLIKLMLFLMG